jgi:arylsulfatase A-like enzyme
MQQYFWRSGYQTAGCGKTMHGARNEHPRSWSVPYPDSRMLKYADGFKVPAHDGCYYQGEKEHEVYSRIPEDRSDWRTRFYWMREQGAMPSTEFLDVPDDAYLEGALANYSIGLLEKFSTEERPFFLTVGFVKPHLPFVAPKKYLDLYDPDDIELPAFREKAANSPFFAYHTFGELRSYTDIPSDFSTPIEDMKQKELIRAYYACVSYVDAQIGKILDKLDELGMADNTILVLWGDHGWHLGDHGMWCKHSNFEQATRAPLIFAAPGYAGGQKASGPTEFVDIFPTLCELAGLEVPASLEGTSLVPVMKDPAVKVKDFAVSQYPRGGNRMGYALRNDRYRLVLWMKNDWRSTQPFDEALVEDMELYDYENDPLETVSQARNPEYGDVLELLKGLLLEHFRNCEE